MSYLFTSQRELPQFRHLEAEPLSGALGATISGVNLADDLAGDVIDEIYAAQPEDEHSVEIDPKFLARLNANRHGMVFTPGAAARLKKIPRMFRGAAISAVIAEAQERGSAEANIAILDAVQAKRRGG